MKKIILILGSILLIGCLSTENRKIEMGVDANKPDVWWRTQYTAKRSKDNPWDAFVPKTQADPLTEELNYFEENVIKWPKEMPKAFTKPSVAPAPKDPISSEVY